MRTTLCNTMIRTLLACGFLFVAACDDSNSRSAVGESATDPATLCVDNQCGEKTVLLTIPSAENILFADDGRLFVSGGSNVFEITRDDDAYTATALYEIGRASCRERVCQYV